MYYYLVGEFNNLFSEKCCTCAMQKIKTWSLKTIYYNSYINCRELWKTFEIGTIHFLLLAWVDLFRNVCKNWTNILMRNIILVMFLKLAPFCRKCMKVEIILLIFLLSNQKKISTWDYVSSRIVGLFTRILQLQCNTKNNTN